MKIRVFALDVTLFTSGCVAFVLGHTIGLSARHQVLHEETPMLAAVCLLTCAWMLFYAAKLRASQWRRALGYLACGLFAALALVCLTQGWLIPWPNGVALGPSNAFAWLLGASAGALAVLLSSPARMR
ncbi:MAG: hypothetical protein Q8Q09_14805 [Deltaproteobacteria bacterium]|nr:hypothetical protein [Deltaproteobacteria bacterium]